MTSTTKTFPVPAAKLIPWEGYYIYPDGKEVRIYFDLLPNQKVDLDQFYEVNELIGTTSSNKMTVLGKNIINSNPTLTHLPKSY